MWKHQPIEVQDVTERKEEKEKSTITAGDFNTHFSTIKQVDRKINKHKDKFKHTNNRIHILFKLPWNIPKWSWIKNETNLKKFKRIKIIKSMFWPQQNQSRTQKRKITRKSLNTYKLNNTLHIKLVEIQLKQSWQGNS